MKIDLFTYIIYLTLLFFEVVLTWQAIYAKKTCLEDFSYSRINIYHLVALLLISIIVGYRYNVGVDWEGYKQYFQNIDSNEMTLSRNYMERGFYYLNKFISKIGYNYTEVFFIAALFSWYFIFKSIPQTILPLTIYFLFTNEFFFSSMNLIRQFMAMALFLFSLRYIITRKLLFYTIFIILGSLFHYSIILLLPLYYLPYKKLFSPKIWLVLFVITLFMGNMSFFVDWLSIIFNYVFSKIPILSRYNDYFLNGYYKPRDVNRGYGYVFIVISTIYIIITSKSVVEKYPNIKIYYVLFFLGAIIYNMFYEYMLINRINDYFLVIKPILMAQIVHYLWTEKKQYITSLVILLLYFSLYLVTIYTSSSKCSPYNIHF